jgi:hypothetical protein
VNEERHGGRYAVEWNGRDASGRQVSTGVYFYRLTLTDAGGKGASTDIRKMILLK